MRGSDLYKETAQDTALGCVSLGLLTCAILWLLNAASPIALPPCQVLAYPTISLHPLAVCNIDVRAQEVQQVCDPPEPGCHSGEPDLSLVSPTEPSACCCSGSGVLSSDSSLVSCHLSSGPASKRVQWVAEVGSRQQGSKLVGPHSSHSCAP